MRCFSCKKSSEVKHNNRHYCRNCFCKLIERRFSKYLRVNKFIKKHDILLISDPLLESIIQKVVKGMPLKIVQRKPRNSSISKRIVLWTQDDEVSHFISSFFSPSFKLQKPDPVCITPLVTVTDEEARQYALFKKLKFKPNKKPYVYSHLKLLEKKYPELFFSVSRSIKELQKVL